jgi:site-specific DNA-methyltransferase (adenine-specific)
MIKLGDCKILIKELLDNSIDAVVTDPPYGLEFMGKEWDKLWDKRDKNEQTNEGVKTFLRAGKNLSQYKAGYEAYLFHFEWAKEVFRVLKPGGHLLAFGGSRTYHRLACAIEDAGFEIRDQIMWIYGSGFPKALDVSKAIDKMKGAEREIIGIDGRTAENSKFNLGIQKKWDITNPATPEAKYWNGWKSALKPAHEPICLARKPLDGTIAENCLKWGVGALNIDGCRIGTNRNKEPRQYDNENASGSNCGDSSFGNNLVKSTGFMSQGRYPANIILDEEAGAMLDEQSGELKSGDSNGFKGKHTAKIYGKYANNMIDSDTVYADSGGASRFFYCAKSSRSERNAGLEGMEEKANAGIYEFRVDGSLDGKPTQPKANHHPTVKPIKLMEYLIKLVSREGQTILDPFAGSGTTGIACVRLNREFIGFEQEKDYVEIAEKRIEYFKDKKGLFK